MINSLAWIIELSFLAMISFIVATPIGKDAISSNSRRCRHSAIIQFILYYKFFQEITKIEMHSLLMNYRDYITIEPNKRGGKPCIRGLRITVYEVLEYLASEMTEAEILDDFPDLTREDLKACIAYAADRERRLMISTLSA